MYCWRLGSLLSQQNYLLNSMIFASIRFFYKNIAPRIVTFKIIVFNCAIINQKLFHCILSYSSNIFLGFVLLFKLFCLWFLNGNIFMIHMFAALVMIASDDMYRWTKFKNRIVTFLNCIFKPSETRCLDQYWQYAKERVYNWFFKNPLLFYLYIYSISTRFRDRTSWPLILI